MYRRLTGGETTGLSRGIATAYVISESGLYKLVMRRDKPVAKPFQDWVTKEVLPAVRKTGAYQAAPRAPKERPALPPPTPSVPAMRPSHVQPVLCEDAAAVASQCPAL